MFVYQPTLNILELKEDKSTEYVISWKSKGLCISKFNLLYTLFWYSIKLSGSRIRIQLGNSVLFAEKNS